jgi:hypothetical protein
LALPKYDKGTPARWFEFINDNDKRNCWVPLFEDVTENRSVGSSIPLLVTKSPFRLCKRLMFRMFSDGGPLGIEADSHSGHPAQKEPERSNPTCPL